MESSIPFRPKDSRAASSAGENVIQSLFGEYVGLCLLSGVPRKFTALDNTRAVADGSSFEVLRIRLRGQRGEGAAELRAMKLLRGVPLGADPQQYPHKTEFREEQLRALNREVRILADPGLRDFDSNIIRLKFWGFSTGSQEAASDESLDPEWQGMQPYLILEWARYGTLSRFRQSQDCLEVALSLALDVASGIELLHSCEIVHGDIKADNVLICEHPARRYCAKLSDFSHSISADSWSTYLGSERYRPPELALDKQNSSPMTLQQLFLCDIWNFGVLLFEMITVCDFNLHDEEKWLSRSTINHPKWINAASKLSLGDRSKLEQAMVSSLQLDPARRSTMSDARKLLGGANRSLSPSVRTQRLKMPSVLEVVAARAIADEKYWLQKRLVQKSVHGSNEEKSYQMFQIAQAHWLGFGFGIDNAKAVYALAFAAGNTGDSLIPDPIALSLAKRLIGFSLDASGPYEALLVRVEAQLDDSPASTYYVRRIKLFRALGIEHLQNLESNRVKACFDSLVISKTIEHVDVTLSTSIMIESKLLDLVIPNPILLHHFYALTGDIIHLKRLLIPAICHGSRKLGNLDPHGNSVLHYACFGGHASMVEWLCSHFEDLNVPNSDGIFPLHMLPFFEAEDTRKVASLLCNSRSLDAISRDCKIPLHLLHFRGSPLQWSVSCRNLNAVNILLDLQADVNAEAYGYTALALAVEIHASEIVAVLLRAGASTHGIGPFERSAMHFLAGNVPIIRRQCIHGKDRLVPSVKDTIFALERHGCDINARDRHGNTPLHKAIASPLERGNLYVIRALLVHDANKNAQNDNGDSIFHLIAKLSWSDRPSDTDLLKVLVDDSINEDSLDSQLLDLDGRTPHLIGTLLSLGSDLIAVVPLQKEDVIAMDKYGDYFMDLLNKPFEEKFDYFQAYKATIKRVGLDVVEDPNCS